MLPLDEIYCGDAMVLLGQIDDNSIDLVITSPKYNLGVPYDSCQDKEPWEDYYDWCRLWLKEIYRVLKPDGRFCLNHYLSCGTAKSRSAPLMNLNAICEFEIGFKHHGFAELSDTSTCKRCAWGSFLSASCPYISSPREGVDILYKERWKKDRKGESTITKPEFFEGTLGLWKMPPEKSRGGCPAPFPQELPKRCINLLSYVGDTVLDPFNGSGASTFAAKQGGRHFIGIDISEAYCKDAREWLETGVRPKHPVLKKADRRKKPKKDVLTKRCRCGAIIDIKRVQCDSCSWKQHLVDRGNEEATYATTLAELLG